MSWGLFVQAGEGASLARRFYDWEKLPKRHATLRVRQSLPHDSIEELGLRISGTTPDDMMVEIVECRRIFFSACSYTSVRSRPNRRIRVPGVVGAALRYHKEKPVCLAARCRAGLAWATAGVLYCRGLVLLLAVLAYYIGKFVLLRICTGSSAHPHGTGTTSCWSAGAAASPCRAAIFFITSSSPVPRMGPYLHKLCLLFGGPGRQRVSVFLNAWRPFRRLRWPGRGPVKACALNRQVLPEAHGRFRVHSVLIEESPVYLLSGWALDPVLLMVFKDTSSALWPGCSFHEHLVHLAMAGGMPQFGPTVWWWTWPAHRADSELGMRLRPYPPTSSWKARSRTGAACRAAAAGASCGR
jgi:hypothetical protein